MSDTSRHTERTRIAAVRAVNDHLESLRQQLERRPSRTPLPDPRMVDHDGDLRRIEFGYGFARVCAGPVFVNTTGDLDADPYTVHRKTYTGPVSCHVDLETGHPVAVFDSWSPLTTAARAAFADQAAEVARTCIGDGTRKAVLAARDLERERFALARERDVAEGFRRELAKLAEEYGLILAEVGR